jgi:site-specific recombinase XerD
MGPATQLHSPVAKEIRRFLETKRALGRKYRSEERELRLLERYLVQQGVTELEQITPDLLDAFLAARPRSRPRSFNHLLGVVRCLLDWLVAQGTLRASPLRTVRRRATVQRLPFLFDARQARRLLDAAGALPDRPRGPQRGPTYRTLFALLYGLGLRAGEACYLRCDDVDLDRALLVVRGGKFGKSRLVPFGPRIAALLREQLQRRTAVGVRSDSPAPLFTFDGRRSIHPGTASQTFLHLTRSIGFVAPEGASSPRLHDLRHSFAVGTLLRWYREGVDPAARLHHLSTFLGHVNPASTAVYLTITSDLLREAGRRFESFAAPTPWERTS